MSVFAFLPYVLRLVLACALCVMTAAAVAGEKAWETSTAHGDLVACADAARDAERARKFPLAVLRAIALATEGGHATLALANERERSVVAALEARFGRVSIERALSGPELANLALAIADIDGLERDELEPDEITVRALADLDPVAIEALTMFCAMLGGAAGNLALSLGARGGV
jgi:hypothetical protein